ncbi:MAG: FMN-binding negative transcriptional regulator, partial [Planctomycetia bacterium]|nr:FMN-binding negative transcriptional regulator [Planctomycetia bacterium]
MACLLEQVFDLGQQPAFQSLSLSGVSGSFQGQSAGVDQIASGCVAVVPAGVRGFSRHAGQGNKYFAFQPVLRRTKNGLTESTDPQALAVVNGPDGYISARWYSDPDQVPTWNYIALEMEGPVRRMDREGLRALLEDVSAHHEARVAEGTPWTMDKMAAIKRERMMDMIVGFELTVEAWRPTVKLSQNKSAEERARLIEGL